jgi:poly(A) polymerase
MKNVKDFKEQLRAKESLLFIKKFLEKYPQANVYLVGGAVRDFLLGKEVTDFDFVVEGIKKDELETFLSQFGSIKDIESRAFGVFVFRPKGEKKSFDIALPRSDKWQGGGYKDLEVDTRVSIEDDLRRRDFTINALALNLRDFELIDLFKGRRDLKSKIIRTVGKSENRFDEDPSRILRGIRFTNQLSFTIEPNTLEAMKNKANQIVSTLDDGRKRVSEEVIGSEFLKSFDANTVGTIQIYDKIGLLKLLFPEIEAMKGVKQPDRYHSEGDVYQHTLLALEEMESIIKDDNNLSVPKLKTVGMLDENYSIELKLGLLFHDLGKPATFTPPSQEKDRISFNEHDDVGASLANNIIRRLKLTQFPKGDRLHVNDDQVKWLVKKHMILVVAKPKEMRLSTLEKYFFHPSGRGEKLMTLSYCDISATVPESGEGPDYELLNKFLDQIELVEKEVLKLQKERQLPPPLLDGHQIIKILNIKAGPLVGKVKDKIRDLELSGELRSKKEAKEWLLKNKEKLLD